MVRVFPSVSEEVRAYHQLEAQRSQYRSAQEQATPEMAENAGNLHRFFPDIPGEAVEAAAMEGITPDMAEAQWLEEAAVEADLQQTGGHQLGRRLTSDDLGIEPDDEPQPTDGDLNPSRARSADHPEEDDGGLWDTIRDPLQTGVRGSLTALSAPLEAVDSAVTAFGVGVRDEDTSIGEAWADRPRTMATHALQGESLGEGWIPGDEAWDAREEERRQNMTVDGEWMTPGRHATDYLMPWADPEDTTYNIMSGALDAGFSILADPAAIVSLGASRAAGAARLFRDPQNHSRLARAAGMLTGRERTTDAQYAQNFLNSNEGSAMADALANVTESREVWQLFRKKVSPRVANEIADAPTPEAVREILSAHIGTNIRERPGTAVARRIGQVQSRLSGDPTNAAFGFGHRLRMSPMAEHSRLWQWTPHKSVNPQRPDHAADHIDRLMHGVDLPVEVRNRRFRQVAELDDNDWFGMYDAVRGVHDDIFHHLTSQHGFDEEVARKLTRFSGDDPLPQMRAYFADEMGRPGFNPSEFMAHADNAPPQAYHEHGVHLISEFINKDIPLADMRELRQATGPVMGRLLSRENSEYLGLANDPTVKTRGSQAWDKVLSGTGKAVQTTNSVMTRLMSGVWKPMQLLRPAYIARVGLENQFRMAANDYNSVFKHPFEYITSAYKRHPRHNKRLTDVSFSETPEFLDQMQNMNQWQVLEGQRRFVPNGQYTVVGPSADEATRFRGWKTEIGELLADPVSRRLARTGDIDDTMHWLRTEGSDNLDQISRAFRVDEIQEGGLTDRQLRSYLETVSERIRIKAGGRPGEGAVNEIIESIAEGMVPHQSGARPSMMAIGDEGDEALAAMLSRNRDKMPQHVKVELMDERQQAGLWDQAVDMIGQYILASPENWAARSPLLRQAYHRRLTQLMHDMTPEVQDQTIRWARDSAKLSRRELRELRRLKEQGSGSRIQSVEEADALALGFAVDENKRLLYDIRERAHFSEAMRFAAPFAEAWREILSTWGRTIRDYPHIIRRAHEGIEGARTADPNNTGRGFFYEDPSHGSEMFAYPGAGLMTRAIFGADAPEDAEIAPVGQVQGINLIGQGGVLPGFGPVVQFPASYLVSDHPRYDMLKEQALFPFGEPETENPMMRAMEMFAPSWTETTIRGIFQGPDSDRLYANSKMDLMRQMARSPEHDINSREGQERLLEEVGGLGGPAQRLWMIRGFAQAILPTGPSPRFSVEDIEGEDWELAAATNAYYQKVEEFGQEGALEWFLERFGPDSQLLVQPQTREIVPRATDEPGATWERRHQDKIKSYPTTFSMFNPDTDAEADMDYQAYLSQLDKGEREQLTPEEFLALGNNRLGQIAYRQAQRRVPGNSFEDRRFLSIYRAKLEEELPGYGSYLAQASRPDIDEQVDELYRALQDETLANTEAGRGLAQFLPLREQAMEEARNRGYQHYATAQDTFDLRKWITDQAQHIINEHPDFMQIWDRVFQRELEDDVEEVQPPAELMAEVG